MTKKQSEFITRYCREYKTNEQWAQEFNVNRKTIDTWKKIYSIEIDTEREKVRNSYIERLEKLGEKAIETLHDLLTDKSKAIRHKAIETILSRIVPSKLETKNETKITEEVKLSLTPEDVRQYADRLERKSNNQKHLNG